MLNWKVYLKSYSNLIWFTFESVLKMKIEKKIWKSIFHYSRLLFGPKPAIGLLLLSVEPALLSISFSLPAHCSFSSLSFSSAGPARLHFPRPVPAPSARPRSCCVPRRPSPAAAQLLSLAATPRVSPPLPLADRVSPPGSHLLPRAITELDSTAAARLCYGHAVVALRPTNTDP